MDDVVSMKGFQLLYIHIPPASKFNRSHRIGAIHQRLCASPEPHCVCKIRTVEDLRLESGEYLPESTRRLGRLGISRVVRLVLGLAHLGKSAFRFVTADR